jgi:hypothetical protein
MGTNTQNAAMGGLVAGIPYMDGTPLIKAMADPKERRKRDEVSILFQHQKTHNLELKVVKGRVLRTWALKRSEPHMPWCEPRSSSGGEVLSESSPRTMCNIRLPSRVICSYVVPSWPVFALSFADWVPDSVAAHSTAYRRQQMKWQQPRSKRLRKEYRIVVSFSKLVLFIFC